jgi:hypothetical protein
MDCALQDDAAGDGCEWVSGKRREAFVVSCLDPQYLDLQGLLFWTSRRRLLLRGVCVHLRLRITQEILVKFTSSSDLVEI